MEEKIKYANQVLLEECNLTVIGDLFSENYIVHHGNRLWQSHLFIEKYIRQLHKALKDIHILKLDFFIQTQDTIVWQRTLKARHVNKMKGIPASGKTIQWTEMVITRFADGKIAEEWLVSELAGKLMGKVPKPV